MRTMRNHHTGFCTVSIERTPLVLSAIQCLVAAPTYMAELAAGLAASLRQLVQFVMVVNLS